MVVGTPIQGVPLTQGLTLPLTFEAAMTGAAAKTQIYTDANAGNLIQNVPTGKTKISSVNGVTISTLNAAGLGIGAVPTYKLQVVSADASNAILFVASSSNQELVIGTSIVMKPYPSSTNNVNIQAMKSDGVYRSMVTAANSTTGEPTLALCNIATGKMGFYGITPVVKQTDATALTNSVTVGGTTDTVADYADLVVYATDAAAIRNNLYQVARKVKLVSDALRLYGLM